jgi:hypothetical protein
MDPRVLAGWLKKGIEDEQFLIIPYESGPRMVEMELQRFVDYASVEGMKRMEERSKQPPSEEMLKMMSEREGYEIKPGPRPMFSTDSGFAKARKDLDWIDPSKKV